MRALLVTAILFSVPTWAAEKPDFNLTSADKNKEAYQSLNTCLETKTNCTLRIEATQDNLPLIRQLRLTTPVRCKEEAPESSSATTISGVIFHGGVACVYPLERNQNNTLTFLEKLNSYDPNRLLARRVGRQELYKNNCFGQIRSNEDKVLNNFPEIAVDSLEVKGLHIDGISSNKVANADKWRSLQKGKFAQECLEPIESQAAARGTGPGVERTGERRSTDRGNGVESGGLRSSH